MFSVVIELCHGAHAIAPGQWSVKFRMRTIARFGACFPIGRIREPGRDRLHPATNSGNQPSGICGHDRHNDTSRDHAKEKRGPAFDVLT